MPGLSSTTARIRRLLAAFRDALTIVEPPPLRPEDDLYWRSWLAQQPDTTRPERVELLGKNGDA